MRKFRKKTGRYICYYYVIYIKLLLKVIFLIQRKKSEKIIDNKTSNLKAK